MNLLAIETATEACSAALSIDGTIREKYCLAPRKHAELILQMIDDLLREAGMEKTRLDAVAFGRGPGAFTGARIAAGVSQGIAFGLDIPVIPISTLAAIAQQHGERHEQIAAAIDARMRQVYWGLFQKNTDGVMQGMGNEIVCFPEKVPIPDKGHWRGAGSGWDAYHEGMGKLFNGRLSGYESSSFPHAAAVIALALPAYANGEYVSAENAMPVYIRNNVV